MITRRKKYGSQQTEDVRPTFRWSGPNENGFFDTQVCIGQLTEDIRDNLEELNRKQMLQCDVRDDLRRMRKALESINRKLPPRRARRTRRKQ